MSQSNFLTNLFHRKKSKPTKAEPNDPNLMPEPSNAGEYMRRGWAYHSRRQEQKAEMDFQKALALKPDLVDAYYVLGLVLKAQGQNKEAVSYFNQVLSLIASGVIVDNIKAEMLRRLSLGHINELESGDWNLEDQIWHFR